MKLFVGYFWMNEWKFSFHHSLLVTHSLTHSMNLEMPWSIQCTTLRSTGTYNTISSGIVLCHFFIGKIFEKKRRRCLLAWTKCISISVPQWLWSLWRVPLSFFLCLGFTWPEPDQSSEWERDGIVSLFCFSPLTKLFYTYIRATDWKEWMKELTRWRETWCRDFNNSAGIRMTKKKSIRNENVYLSRWENRRKKFFFSYSNANDILFRSCQQTYEQCIWKEILRLRRWCLHQSWANE